jgi:hypothetical protein
MTEDVKGGKFPKRHTKLFMRPPAKATPYAHTTHTAVAKCNKEIQLEPRQLCDVELLMNGGFSPLTGFMDETVSFLFRLSPLFSPHLPLTPSLLRFTPDVQVRRREHGPPLRPHHGPPRDLRHRRRVPPARRCRPPQGRRQGDRHRRVHRQVPP